MSKKVTNASKHPVAIRLVKRAGASVGFSDGIKPAGAVDDSIELSFNLGGYTPDEGRFVIGTSATPNIKNPQTYVNNGEQFKIVNESNRLLIEADITTHDTDPNYSSLTFGIFFRLKNTDGDYVMASPRATQAVVDYKNVKTQIEKTVIKQSVGQWFNDSNYYVPLYLGTLKELLTHWANTTGMGMPELQTLGSKAIYNKVGLTVDLPLTSVTITNVGDFEIGTTVAIEHTFTPAIAKITNVEYSVSDSTIAEFVGTTNQLQIKSMGSVDVTVTLTDNIGNEMSTTKTFNTVLDFVPLIASYAVNNSLVSLNIAGHVEPTGYVDWGDGTLEPVTTGALSHQYVGAGQRDVTLWVETPILGLQFVAGNALTEVKQWGDVTFPVVALTGNTELVKVPNQIPKGLTGAASMFEGCVKFNQSLNGWDVSGILNMTNMFKGASTFNGLIDAWDVSKVVAFERMFEGAISFNQNINTWVMSAARNLTYMFKGAAQYNQPIAAWRLPLTGGTVNVSGMFEDATSFNQSIVGFVNTNVAYLGGMLKGCSNFNQPVSGVAFAADAQIQGMFEDCISFNSSVGNFNGAKPTNLRDLFKGCSNFNQTLVGLDMSECTVAESFLEGCARFNQPLNDMDVSNLNNATNMFKGCAIFTSDLSDWDVSNLHQANGMFNGTTNFDSDLGWWCVSNLQSEPVDFATGSFLARSNYPKWGTCPVRNVTLTIDNETPYLIVGSTGTLTYTANKPITEESVVWSSSNPSAVTINETTGEYAVITVGGATITVTVNGIYSTTRTYETVQAITPAVLVVGQHADPLTIRLDSDTSRTGEAYVDWGDGTFDRLTSINSLSKTYATAGPFNVSVMPSSPIGSGLVINGDGVTALTAFGECDISITSSNLESVPASLPATVTSFGFQDCVKLNDPNISNWNVNNIKNFSGMFAGAIAFNQPLNNWVMAQATDLSWMFGSEDGISAFNQNIAGWDVSKVTNMNGMFYNAASFNQDIGTWSVSKVTDMGDMFKGAAAMVADLSWWCVSTITETPTDFATGSGLVDGNLPYWGTCPIRTAVAIIDAPQVVTVGDTFPFSYSLNPAFTPGKVEWTTSTPLLLTLDLETGIATVTGDGQANLTVTINDKIVGSKQLTAMPAFTPFTAVTAGEYFDLRTMKGAAIVMVDGVELAPDEPYEGEPEDEVYDWYSSMTSAPGSILTVSPKDSVSPLASIKIGSGISEVTEWCSLGHVASPGDTKSPVIFGQDIVSVPDYLPAEITNLTEMFYGATLFNDPNIVNWDLSNVTTLQSMFIITRAFNQPIGNWNVSKVTDLSKMFYDSPVFNQDLSGWDVSNVTDTNQMFYKAVAFNQPLNTWNVGKVTNMSSMFAASGYDQPLDQWVFPELRDMSGMFNSAAFNQPIGNWDVSNVQYMSYLFAYTAKFNQPLPNWNLGKVWEGAMTGMFTENTIFNQDLSGWCVSLNRFEPNVWNTNGIISPENYPYWGTCPIANAVVTINAPATADLEEVIPLSYTLDPEFTPGKVEWSTTTPDLVLIDTDENTAIIVDHGTINLTVTINKHITATASVNVLAPKVPFTAITTGNSLIMTAPQDKVKLFVDGVEIVPTGSGWVNFNATLDGTPKTVTVTSTTPSGKLGEFYFEEGIANVTHWGDDGFEPDKTIRFGKDLIGVPKTAPPGLKKLESLFSGSSLFNDPNILEWDVSEVTDMSYMFLSATAFNQPIGSWKVGSVVNMAGLFYGTTSFNQDLSGWCVTNITTEPSDFGTDSALGTTNYPVWGTCPVPAPSRIMGFKI